MNKYTPSQLALRNGQDMDEIWVAYKNKIYDVTGNRYWLRGMHYKHWAGQDLTEEMKKAPHPDSIMNKFNVIGILEKQSRS